jgi:hypothetical protein
MGQPSITPLPCLLDASQDWLVQIAAKGIIILFGRVREPPNVAAGLATVEDVDRLLQGAALMMATADKPVMMATADKPVMMATADKPMMMAPTWWAVAGWQMSDLGRRCPF